jgi:hypothetical protein
MHYCLGESSKRVIIHQQDDLCVTYEHLFQDTTPTRFYQNQTDTFCFVIKGELYLQEDEKETALKKHQGIWLKANRINSVTLLSPNVELCFIRFKMTDDNITKPLNKVASGTVESTLGRNHIKTWPLWQGKSGAILLELYPPHYNETLYYQKDSTQYILPLNCVAFISNDKKQPKACDVLGQVVLKKEPRAISNPSNDNIIMLSVTTSHIKGRVLLLTKTNNDTSDTKNQSR